MPVTTIQEAWINLPEEAIEKVFSSIPTIAASCKEKWSEYYREGKRRSSQHGCCSGVSICVLAKVLREVRGHEMDIWSEFYLEPLSDRDSRT